MGRPTNPSAQRKTTPPQRRSGRAAFEADGRSIWEWQTSTGVFERNVTAEQISSLESAELALVEENESNGRTLYDPTPTIIRGAPVRAVKSPAIAEGSMLTRLLRRLTGRH